MIEIEIKSSLIKIIGVIFIVIILIIASFYFVFLNNDQDGMDEKTDGKDDNQKPSTEKEIEITTSTSELIKSDYVGSKGGTVSISDSNSPLYGFNIDVPKSATDCTVSFDISYSDIDEIKGIDEDINFASKMISIETDGNENWNEYKSFEKPCLVTMPYDSSLVTNEEAVRFYSYDSESGKLEATGFLSQDIDANTITFYAGTFSKFLGIEIAKTPDKFEKTDEIDTGFRPKTDGWFITNYGSQLSPGGMCLGMVTYAKWFFAYKKATGENLFPKYIEGKEDEWRDDDTAIELATRCQLGAYGIWSSLNDDELDYVNTTSKNIAYSIIHGMTVSGEPQLIGLRTRFANGTWAKGGHAIMTYRYSGGRFDVYDPNFPETEPGTDVRQIPFDNQNGFTRVYASGQNAASGRQYNTFYHASLKTFSPLKTYSELYDEAEKKFEDNSLFPDVELTDISTNPVGATPYDTDGDKVRDTGLTTCTVTGTIKGGIKTVYSTLIFVNGQKYWEPLYSDAFAKTITLLPGVNEIIILATNYNTRTRWAGYLRETIHCTAFKSSFTLTLTWEPDETSLNLHVLEPTIDGFVGRHMYPHGGQGADSGYPYMTADDLDGLGPEIYIASENMTLPNYHGGGKSLYGTYTFRVHYMYDNDDDFNNTQPVNWTVHLNYLAFNDSVKGIDYWEEKKWTGTLAEYDFYLFWTFDATSDDWSPKYEVKYSPPNPVDYGIPPPPQSNLPS